MTTNSSDPPKLNSMRCVPKNWTKAADDKPTKLWDDSGSGGRPGSFWIVSKSKNFAIGDGHRQPNSNVVFYNLIKNKSFIFITFYQLLSLSFLKENRFIFDL